jgi:hypothetical protein
VTLRRHPTPHLGMPEVYLRSIEALIAVVLDRVCGNVTPLSPQTRYRCPSLGVSSLDLGRLWQRRRPFFTDGGSVSGGRRLKERTPRLAPGRPQPPTLGCDVEAKQTSASYQGEVFSIPESDIP